MKLKLNLAANSENSVLPDRGQDAPGGLRRREIKTSTWRTTIGDRKGHLSLSLEGFDLV
jgi:hypothetical protein